MALRIGLLGASRIAPEAILEPAAAMGDVRVTRIAASAPARAESFAAKHSVEGTEPDYASLVRSEEVDLVYNALPPSGHMPWTLAALGAGKAVLCEKPFALNALQATRMVQAAKHANRPLIEALHYRFHPLMERTLALVRGGEIGEPRELHAHFNVSIPHRPGELRHTLEVGGGALMDLGCYPVHWLRTIMGVEPDVRTAKAVQGSPGIDVSMRATLDFAGVPATVACCMEAALPCTPDAQLRVRGTRGTLHVDNLIAPHRGHMLWWRSDGAPERTETVAGRTTYWHQLAHVKAVVDGCSPALTGGADAVANMAVIDAVYAAAGMRPRGDAA